MSQALSVSNTSNVPSVNVFEPYSGRAFWGMLATSVCTLINPITGAAVGTYYVSSIAASAMLDRLTIGSAETMGKVAKLMISILAGFTAAYFVLSALGVTFSMTPPAIGAVIAMFSVNVLSAIRSV
jgi:hypothetical protein